MNHSLDVENLSFAFNQRLLFKNVSLAVKAGEALHLTGPNGAGKSTLMSILAGLRQQTAGKIRFHAASGEIIDRRAMLSYLAPESNGHYLKRDAVSNLRFWYQLRHSKPLADDILNAELVHWGLGHRLVRSGLPVEKFSTGMKRRLGLARLSLSQSSLWLLDEPLFGLDTKAIDTFIATLNKHRQGGGSVVVISHDTAPFSGLISQQIDITRYAKGAS